MEGKACEGEGAGGGLRDWDAGWAEEEEEEGGRWHAGGRASEGCGCVGSWGA